MFKRKEEKRYPSDDEIIKWSASSRAWPSEWHDITFSIMLSAMSRKILELERELDYEN